jgi:hypothetical protein
VPTGCACNAGFVGAIFASTTTPFFTGSCTGECHVLMVLLLLLIMVGCSDTLVVACPSHSSGTAPACTCRVGFTGSVTAILGGYASTCSREWR